MIVKSLELDFFRNYVHLEAVFDPRVNLIYGDNAQGKTNLLEAVAYLSTARSHRARYDREMIMLGVDGAFVKGEVRSRARDFTLEARLNRAGGNVAMRKSQRFPMCCSIWTSPGSLTGVEPEGRSRPAGRRPEICSAPRGSPWTSAAAHTAMWLSSAPPA